MAKTLRQREGGYLQANAILAKISLLKIEFKRKENDKRKSKLWMATSPKMWDLKSLGGHRLDQDTHLLKYGKVVHASLKMGDGKI